MKKVWEVDIYLVGSDSPEEILENINKMVLLL